MAPPRWDEIACEYIKHEELESEPVATIICSVLGIIISPLIACSNGLVLISILRSPFLRVPSNILICLLAFSDFLVGFIFLPVQTSWLLNDYLHNSCAFFIVMKACSWVFVFASFLSVVAVSCERFLALFQPLKYPSLVTISRVGIVGCVIWVISIFLSALSLLFSKRIATVIALVLAIPGIVVILYIYYRIFKLVRKHHFQIRSQQEVSNAIDGNAAERAHQRKLAVTMGYAIGVFLVCYAPSVVKLLIIVVVVQNPRIDNLLCLITLTVYAISSLCNPLIYCGRTGEIRIAVKSTLSAIKSFICVKSVGISNNHITEIRIRCSSVGIQNETKPQLKERINKTDHKSEIKIDSCD